MNGKGLVWTGCLLGYIGGRIGAMVNPVVSYIIIIIALGIVLYGCFLWVKWKNRHWAFMLWGISAPISLLGISLLKDKGEVAPTFKTRLKDLEQ